MKKTLLVLTFLFASLPLAFSRLVLLSNMLNECDEYWEVRIIELNEAGEIVKNELVASGIYDHCAAQEMPDQTIGAPGRSAVYLEKFSEESVRFRILPNPGATTRSIRYSSESPLPDIPATIVLIGPKGGEQTLWRGQLSGKEGTIDQLELDNLPDGNYYIIFRIQGLRPVTAQLVKLPENK